MKYAFLQASIQADDYYQFFIILMMERSKRL